jgi:pimeloyl-ACP methyl ester carboxylesterase
MERRASVKGATSGSLCNSFWTFARIKTSVPADVRVPLYQRYAPGIRHTAANPLDDAGPLKAVEVPVLLIGAEGDPRHPAEVTRRLAGLLPNATAHVYPEPGLLWRYRSDLRSRISGFLNGSA